MIIEGGGSPEFAEKLKSIKMSRMSVENLTTEQLIAKMQELLDCKIWIDEAGEWHFQPNNGDNDSSDKRAAS